MQNNINIRFLSFLLLIVSSLTIKAQDNCFELVWNDEFNYNGLPDSTKWSFEVGNSGWGNNELQYYTSARLENARVEDSVLIIEARKEAYGGSQYTSARLNTYANNLSWKNGKIEARIKLPFGQGIWPAFWMLGDAIFEGTPWPACGEIDIMEMIGGGEGRDDKTYGTIHWADANGNHAQYGGSYQLSEGILADDFHVYSIEWDDFSIKWFIDGQQFHIVDITPVALSEFRKNFFIILNLAVGGDWPGYPNESTVFPQQMMVDYVRVYQKGIPPEIDGQSELIKAQSEVVFSTIESDEFSYNWSVPEDAQIVQGQGTPLIHVNWGCIPGNVTCELVAHCHTYNLTFSVNIKELEITGKTQVDENEKNIIYHIPPAIHTTYNWKLPEMVSSTANLDTNVVLLNWGNKDGVIKVSIENVCGIDSAMLQVFLNRQLPFPIADQPHVIPGTIQSVYFDFGGEGIAYHDADIVNQGTGIRQDEGVDTEANDDGENVGWIETGEWLEYTIAVQSTKLYDAEIRIASPSSTGKFKLLFNNEERTEVISVPSTTAWNKFSSIYVNDIEIKESDTLMRISIVNGGFNLGRLVIADSIPNAIKDEETLSKISLFPTIVSNELTIKDVNESVEYTIIDISGKELSNGTFFQESTIDVSNLTNGIYLLILKTKNQQLSKRFIKTN